MHMRLRRVSSRISYEKVWAAVGVQTEEYEEKFTFRNTKRDSSGNESTNGS